MKIRTLNQLIDAVQVDPDLKDSRRKLIASDLCTLSRWLQAEPSQLNVNEAFRERVRNLSAAALEVSADRFTCVRSSLSVAMRLTGFDPLRSGPLAPVWDSFYRSLGDGNIKWRLSVFIHFCSARDIAPENVDHHTIRSFVEERQKSSVKKVKVAYTIGRVRSAWNDACDRMPGWEVHRLAPIAKCTPLYRPLSDVERRAKVGHLRG